MSHHLVLNSTIFAVIIYFNTANLKLIQNDLKSECTQIQNQ
jgi:hypothetical protein